MADHEKTIATRTRTKQSLVDVELEELEEFLGEDVIDDNEDDEMYQDFLSSLLPNATTHYFEGDDEEEYFQPEDDFFEEEDDEEASISRDELTDLLFDSTKNASLPVKKKTTAFPKLRPDSKYSRIHGSLTSQQCIQLASQMHKHVQLLAQGLALVSLTDPSNKKGKKQFNDIRTKLNRMLFTIQHRANGQNKIHENQMAVAGYSVQERPITRALANAIMNPSMFHVHGIESVNAVVPELAQFFITGKEEVIENGPFQVDRHFLPPTKSKMSLAQVLKRNIFSKVEDRLLARGSEQLGRSFTTKQYEHLCNTFVPSKTPKQCHVRYRYLLTNKAPANPVRHWHNTAEFINVCNRGWTPYEDIRLIRGMLMYSKHDDSLSSTATQLFTWRSRSQVRKRWERLRTQFIVNGHVDVKLMEAFVKQVPPQRIERKVIGKPPKKGFYNRLESYQLQSGKHSSTIESAPCAIPNIHAGLFYTGWARLEPSTLLRNSCDHSWPSSIAHDEPQQPSSPLYMQSTIPEEVVEPEYVSDATQYSEIDHSGSSDSDFEQEELLSDHEEHRSDDDFEYEEIPSSDEEKKPSPKRMKTMTWTKAQDRVILVAAKAHGPSLSTWTAVTKHLQFSQEENITVSAIQRRYEELISLLKSFN